ncbi:hypothetical protein [Bremerella sp.]|uniref:hypothetical protein n=1 Tax=Bremerella sp. TaxID=2795602 RepID=UPI00391D9A96
MESEELEPTVTHGELNDAIWCVVANIKRAHPFGPAGEDEKIGTRQFRGGTKVYIAGCFPGMCASVVCIGRHRHSRQLVKCTVNVRWVENFRVKMVHHPHVLRMIESNSDCWIRTKAEAKNWAAAFPVWQQL